jgi:hypothetical protein
VGNIGPVQLGRDGSVTAGNALAKIHQSACDLLDGLADHDEPAIAWSEEP